MSAPSTDAAAMRHIIRALRADDWTLVKVFDGEEDVPVTNESEAIEAITAVDDAYLFVKRGEESGWVFFVLGNEPLEVACNYTTNLTAVDRVTREWW